MTINVFESDNSIILNTLEGDKLGVNNVHFDAEYLQRQNLVSHTAEGRGTVYFFTLGNTQLVLRHYKRGGLVAKLSDDKFIYTGLENSRSYKELKVLQVLRECGVKVPEPISGRVLRSGIFYTADIICTVIDAACEVHELLQKESVADEIWQNIGIEIRKMHDAQICHYDLNVKNILVSNPNIVNVAHLLDFDKCEVRDGNNWKHANLERLQRSLLKQSKAHQKYCFRQHNWKALIAAYNGYIK